MMPGMVPAGGGGGGGQHLSAGVGAIRVGIGLLPPWLALLWTLVLVAVVVSHARHLLASGGERRLWHSSHVLIAVGMAVMFAPLSIGQVRIPALVWQLLFANAGGVVLVVLLGRALDGLWTNLLWLTSAAEMLAMVYMWTGHTVAVVSWTLAGYFLAVSVFWLLGADRLVDGRAWPRLRGGVTERGESAGAVAGRVASGTLSCGVDVRVSLATMAFAMVQMLTAMTMVR